MERDDSTVGTVYVLDNDAGFRASMIAIAEAMHCRVQAYATVEELCESGPMSRPSCTVVDHVLGDGLFGSDAMRQLRSRGWHMPVIVCTAYASISLAVEYMRGGASMFLEKPLQGKQIATQIADAIELDQKRMLLEEDYGSMRLKFDGLTTRQKELIGLLSRGLICKRIAEVLDVSRRTIDIEKAAIYRILEVDSPIELGLWISKLYTLHQNLGHSHSEIAMPEFHPGYLPKNENYSASSSHSFASR